jgi:hypothetical protein
VLLQSTAIAIAFRPSVVLALSPPGINRPTYSCGQRMRRSVFLTLFTAPAPFETCEWRPPEEQDQISELPSMLREQNLELN